MPAEKPVARLKQEITELPSHSHSENNIMYIKQEIHGRDETVSVQETNNEVIAAKKRGRKKKSESTNTESYSNLRGKRVDYNALITDNNDDEAPKKKRKRNTKTAVEIENDEGSSRQINAVTNETSTETVAAEEDPLALIPVEAPRRRGRKSKAQKAADRKQRRLQEVCEVNSGPIVCGRCNLSMEGNKWKNHKQQFHNDLAWKSDEPPIDLNNRTLVVSILTKVYKAQRPLNCENCGLKKKSVLGFLSHKMQCEKSAEEIVQMKVNCELCGNSMLPVSMAAHMRLSHGPKTREMKTTPDILQQKSKRRAAERAADLIHSVVIDANSNETEKAAYRFISPGIDFLTKLRAKQKLAKEFEKDGHVKCKFSGCSFLGNSVVQATEHMQNCQQKPDIIFACRLCLLVYNNAEDAAQHVINDHSQIKYEYSVEDLSSDGEEEDFNISVHKLKPSREPRFLAKCKVPKSASILYPLAYHWSSKFCKNYYNIPKLYQNFLVQSTNWNQIGKEYLEMYSPEVSHSVDIAIKKVTDIVDFSCETYTWRKLELFESIFSDGTTTFFCGGPVAAVAWAPTPHDENVEQILAVAIVTNFDKKFYINERNSDAAMIQFWNFGVLDNENWLVDLPRLEFCLCRDFGFITHMEWCPSGCYDVENDGDGKLQRLGILAVASSDSFVHIFAIPKPSELNAKLLRSDPVLKLCLQLENEQKLSQSDCIPTKLSWTKARGHRYIAVGYSNGLVALFDLNTNFSPLKTEELLLPIKVFQPHSYVITALHLYHTSDGCRWLATASLDRYCKFWDLTNIFSPIDSFKKVVVTDGVWLTHWSSAVFGFDDSGIGNSNTPTLVYPAREFRCESKSIMYSAATITTIASSDWLNGIVQGNSSGELIGTFPHQLMVGVENDRALKNKKVLLSFARLVEKNLEPRERSEIERKKFEAMRNKVKKTVKRTENSDVDDSVNSHFYCYEPFDYESTDEKYGIVFCDTDMVWTDKKITDKLEYQSEYLLLEQSNTYPLTKVNKTSFNPNKQSYVYLATGYQAGFVRVTSLRNLKAKR